MYALASLVCSAFLLDGCSDKKQDEPSSIPLRKPSASAAASGPASPAAETNTSPTPPPSAPPAELDVDNPVKATATEIDRASDIDFKPAEDPYCKGQDQLTDILKEAGYDIDQELRKVQAITDEEEEKIGEEAFREVGKLKEFSGKVDTPAMAAEKKYITELAAPLLAQVSRKGIHYDFHTIDQDVVNAFAIPGGHIFFYRGILEKPRRIENEAQLVGVLAHEINHVDRRHTIAIFDYLKALGGLGGDASEIGQVIIAMARHPFTSRQEDEADEYAVKFLIGARYSPKQFVTMWQTWSALDKERSDGNPIADELDALLRTHSRSSKRACNAMKVAMASKDPRVSRYYVGRTNFKERKPRSEQQY